LPIVAPDAAIFREVLESSGVFIDPADPASSAARITGLLGECGWRSRYVTLDLNNIERWNALARADRDAVITLIAKLAAHPTPPASRHGERHLKH
jgi:hypothetical protein